MKRLKPSSKVYNSIRSQIRLSWELWNEPGQYHLVYDRVAQGGVGIAFNRVWYWNQGVK